MTSNPGTCEQSLNDTLLLRSVYDNIEAQTRNLENLGLKSDTYGPLFDTCVTVENSKRIKSNN